MSFQAMISPIDDGHASKLINTRVWTQQSPVALDRLVIIQCPFYNFEGKVIPGGKLMVLDTIAPCVVHIFEELYKLKFPLQSLRLMDDFNGDDQASMAANNSSAFNCRFVAGQNQLSIHSYGLAIDINPWQNPCLYPDHVSGTIICHPVQGSAFINRYADRPGKQNHPGLITTPIVNIFKRYGFSVWGGLWDDPIDYHHFQVQKDLAALLVRLPCPHGQEMLSHQIDVNLTTNVSMIPY